MAGYTPTQAYLFDRAALDFRLVLRVKLPNDLYLVSHGETYAPATLAGTGAVPCITSFSDCEHGFTIGGDEDLVANITVTALNVTVPVLAPTPPASNPEGNPGTGVKNARLADYLMDVTNGWGTRPVLGNLFMTVPSAAGTFENEAGRHYLFRGVLHDFEVSGDGREVVMRFAEDLRYNRRCPPYPITQSIFKNPSKSAVGLPLPIAYGVFGLWSLVAMQQGTYPSNYGPLLGIRPWFPICLNGAFAYEVNRAPNTTSSSPKTSHYIFGATNRQGAAGYAVMPQSANGNWQAIFLNGQGGVAMIGPQSSVFGTNDINSVDIGNAPADEFGDATALHDCRNLGIAEIGSRFRCFTSVLPLLEADSTAPAPTQGVTNLPTLPNWSAEHCRETAKLFDGDMLSYLRDDVPSTTTRQVTYELGPEQNLGAIVSIKPYVVWRLINGAGTVTFNFYVDYATDAASSTGNPLVVTLTAGMTNLLQTTSADHSTAIRGGAPQVERWEFRQDNVEAYRGRGMRFTLKWAKSSSTTVIDLVQVGLLVEFNPSRSFVSNEFITLRDVIRDEERGTTKIVERVQAYRVTEQVTPREREAFYVGLGHIAEGTAGTPEHFPGTTPFAGSPANIPNVICNPAEVIRHLLWTYGGRALDNVEYPLISALELAKGTGDIRDFDATKTVLDDLAAEATGLEQGAVQKFRIAVSVGQESNVKSIVRAIQLSVPGLHVFRVPLKVPTDTEPRGRIGCVFPYPGQPVNYRRPVSLRNDTLDVSYRFTPDSDIVNDLKLRYGYSAALGGYTRLLWFGADVEEHGWPINRHYSGTSSTPPDLLGQSLIYEIRRAVTLSQERHGVRDLKLELPFVYRAHEALAIRNNLIRWRSTPRLRLLLKCTMAVADLLPGDVFVLDDDSQDFMGSRFPMAHALTADGAGASSWSGKTFLVERTVCSPTAGGPGSTFSVQAIYNGRVFGVP